MYFTKIAFLVFSFLSVPSAYGTPMPGTASASEYAVSNRPILVNMRIEGGDKTIFEGPVLTRGHNITTALGGNHHCDGTNNHENPSPGATPNAALADLAKKQHFVIDGAFFSEFDDFLISSIAGEVNTDTQFWTTLVNFQFIPVGGCQQRIHPGDQVLYAFDGFAKTHILKLSGPVPPVVKVNQPIVFTVTDGLTGNPVEGAVVHGEASDENGTVSVVFAKKGVNGIKATKDDSLRSNQINVLVV